MPFITGIILAAGESKRMGKTKQLLPYEKATLLEKVIDNVLASNIQEVIVVLGHDAGRIKEVLREKPVKIALNAEYHLGMASSLKAGLIHMHRDSQGFLVILGDQPLIRSNIINQVIENFALNGKGIIFPIYQSQKGHPVLFHVKYKEAVISLLPQEPIARIIELNLEDVLPIHMEDKEILVDVDYPEDYLSLVISHLYLPNDQ